MASIWCCLCCFFWSNKKWTIREGFASSGPWFCLIVLVWCSCVFVCLHFFLSLSLFTSSVFPPLSSNNFYCLLWLLHPALSLSSRLLSFFSRLLSFFFTPPPRYCWCYWESKKSCISCTRERVGASTARPYPKKRSSPPPHPTTSRPPTSLTTS